MNRYRILLFGYAIWTVFWMISSLISVRFSFNELFFIIGGSIAFISGLSGVLVVPYLCDKYYENIENG